MFVCRCVCLSVCRFVCYRRHTGRTIWAINTKLGTNMEPVCGMSCILFGVDDVTDDAIRSKSRSHFEIIITSLIFELERRSETQNVGHALSLFDNTKKFTPAPQFRHLKVFWNIHAASIWHQVFKDRPKLCKKKFMVMTSSMTSQEDLKIVPLYSHINEKWTFFVITKQIPDASSSY